MNLQERIEKYVPLNELERVLKYLFLNNISPEAIDYESKAFQRIVKPEKNMSYRETENKFRRILSSVASGRYLATDMFIPKGRSLYIRKFPRYLNDDIHYHKDALEINVVLQGEFYQRISGNILKMKAGDICFVAPNAGHGTRACDDNTVTLSIMIYQDSIKALLDRIQSGDNPLIIFLKRILYGENYHPFLLCETGFDTDLAGIVIDMENTQDDPSSFVDSYMETGLELFILRLLMKYQDRIVLGNHVSKNDTDILNLLDYIEANYKSITLNSLAATYNYSPGYLSGLISAQYGRTFHEIITDLKMKQACILLTTTDYSMARIAEEVGYTDKCYFLRRFKMIYHMTPSEFRKAAAGGGNPEQQEGCSPEVRTAKG